MPRNLARSVRFAALLAFAGMIGPAAVASAGTAQPPAPARGAGFVERTFAASDISRSDIDFGQTLAGGKKLYFWNFFGCQAADGEVKLLDHGAFAVTSHCGPGGTLVTGARKPGGPGFVGTAFGGGGYFEAELAWDPASVDLGKGHPAFWSMSAEHLWQLPAAEWPGQAQVGKQRYEHFVEPDIFEALLPVGKFPRAYFGSMHEYWGVYNRTCPRLCQLSSGYWDGIRTAPAGTDWSQFHRIGLLWVPATASRPGTLAYYLDGRQLGPAFHFERYTGSETPPVRKDAPWRFGVIDQQHLVLIFGAGPDAQLRVKSVAVWQRSAAQNLVG
jgi:hypothetical protein